MELNKKDIVFKYTRGKGPGGQHKNKTDSCVTATYDGISVTIDGRNQHANKRKAIRELELKVAQAKKDEVAAEKKKSRDYKIHNEERIRTYDFSRGIVTDHRTKKTASIKDILEKGLLNKLRNKK